MNTTLDEIRHATALASPDELHWAIRTLIHVRDIAVDNQLPRLAEILNLLGVVLAEGNDNITAAFRAWELELSLTPDPDRPASNSSSPATTETTQTGQTETPRHTTGSPKPTDNTEGQIDDAS